MKTCEALLTGNQPVSYLPTRPDFIRFAPPLHHGDDEVRVITILNYILKYPLYFNYYYYTFVLIPILICIF